MDEQININLTKKLNNISDDIIKIVDGGRLYDLSDKEIKEILVVELKQLLRIKKED